MNHKRSADFARRLHTVATDLGLPEGRGRIAAMAKVFRVTPNAAKKWLDGQGLPELSKAIEIADKAQVSVLWLLQGNVPKSRAEGSAKDIIAEAAGALSPQGLADVADFLRYKLGQSPPAVAQEKRPSYLEGLERIAGHRNDQERAK